MAPRHYCCGAAVHIRLAGAFRSRSPTPAEGLVGTSACDDETMQVKISLVIAWMVKSGTYPRSDASKVDVRTCPF